jgi:hypothetical protein
MDRFLVSLLGGFIAGITFGLCPALRDSKGDNDEWGDVGTLLGFIAGFGCLIWGFIFVITGGLK